MLDEIKQQLRILSDNRDTIFSDFKNNKNNNKYYELNVPSNDGGWIGYDKNSSFVSTNNAITNLIDESSKILFVYLTEYTNKKRNTPDKFELPWDDGFNCEMFYIDDQPDSKIRKFEQISTGKYSISYDLNFNSIHSDPQVFVEGSTFMNIFVWDSTTQPTTSQIDNIYKTLDHIKSVIT